MKLVKERVKEEVVHDVYEQSWEYINNDGRLWNDVVSVSNSGMRHVSTPVLFTLRSCINHSIMR